MESQFDCMGVAERFPHCFAREKLRIYIVMASRKELKVWSVDDLPGLDKGLIGLRNSPTQNGELYPLEAGRAGVIVEGSAEELAESILEKIASAGIQV